MSYNRYLKSPSYWFRLALTVVAFVLIYKYCHNNFYLQMLSAALVWGVTPRMVIRLVRRFL